MKIKFVGAVGQVTGSCIWCVNERTATQFLVDCGMVQGERAEAENIKPFPFKPEELDFVLLTHAHTDHCGRIPQLYAQGFRGKVICTSATAQLAHLQLRDAYGQAQRRGQKSAVPIPPSAKWFRPVEEWCRGRGGFQFKKPLWIADGLRVTFRRSSHMLGCCSITVSWPLPRGRRNSICFSGDVGPVGGDNLPFSLMAQNQAPQENCPYLVVESTYGGKKPRKNKYKDFFARVRELEEVVSKHRTVVIPCFSMQRAQEVLFDVWNMLHQDSESGKFPGLEVVLDSPMAKAACKIFRKELTSRESVYLFDFWKMARKLRKLGDFNEALGGGTPSWISHAKIRSDQSGAGSKSANAEFHPSDGKKRIIVTSSGMCHAGPVLSYLPLLRDKNTAFIVTGFQNTLNGKELQRIARKQGKGKWNRKTDKARLRLGEGESGPENIRVRAGVFDLAPYYSGHADIDGLLEYVLKITELDILEDQHYGADFNLDTPPAVVFLNHGDDPSRENLRKKIKAGHIDYHLFNRRVIAEVEIPKPDSPFFDLDRGEWAEESPTIAPKAPREKRKRRKQ